MVLRHRLVFRDMRQLTAITTFAYHFGLTLLVRLMLVCCGPILHITSELPVHSDQPTTLLDQI